MLVGTKNREVVLPTVPNTKIEPKDKDIKTENAVRKAIREFIIETPVKALAPAAFTLGGGAIGMAVAGIPGAIIGVGVGANTGLYTSDKIAKAAGKAFDKGIDFAAEKIGAGATKVITYVADKAEKVISYVYEKIKTAYDKAIATNGKNSEDIELLEIKDKVKKLKVGLFDNAEEEIDFGKGKEEATKSDEEILDNLNTLTPPTHNK